MSAEDLEKYEAEMELQLYREYRDVVGIFKYVVETDRRFYLCNQVDVKARTEAGDVFFEVSMTDAWVWDMYRPARFAKNVKVLTFKDVNVEELAQTDLEPPRADRLFTGSGVTGDLARNFMWSDDQRSSDPRHEFGVGSSHSARVGWEAGPRSSGGAGADGCGVRRAGASVLPPNRLVRRPLVPTHGRSAQPCSGLHGAVAGAAAGRASSSRRCVDGDGTTADGDRWVRRGERGALPGRAGDGGARPQLAVRAGRARPGAARRRGAGVLRGEDAGQRGVRRARSRR